MADFIKANPGKEIESANFATAGSLLFLGTSILDAKAISSGIMELAGAFPGADEAKESIAQAEEALGFSLEKDLVPAIGNEVALVVNKVDLESGPFPSVDLGIVIKVADESKMKKVIGALEKMGAGFSPEGLQSKKVAGADAKFVPVPLPGLQPGFTINKGFLIIGTTESGLADILNAKSGKGNLSGSAEFKKLAPRITTAGQTLTFLNLGKAAEIGLKFAGRQAAEDKDAEAVVKRVSNVLKLLGVTGGTQSVKDGLLVTDSVLTLN
jgi:hypothetical protein